MLQLPVQFNDHRTFPMAGTFSSLVNKRIFDWCHPNIEKRFGGLSINNVPREITLCTILTPSAFRPSDHLDEVLQQAKGKGYKYAGFWGLVWIALDSLEKRTERVLHFSELPLVAPDTEIDLDGKVAFPALTEGPTPNTFRIRLILKSHVPKIRPSLLGMEQAQNFIGTESSISQAA
jgi:hypothetical protein